MNKSITSSCLLLAVIVIFLEFNYENNTANAQRVLQTYENDKYGIKVQYPANWEIRENTFSSETGELLAQIHPFGKSEPFVSIRVHFLSPENATLQSFTEQELKSIQKPLFDGQVIKILNQNSSVTLGGYPAHKAVYESAWTSSFDGKPELSKDMSIWTVLETEAYILTFVGVDREQYDQYIKTAEKIIDSFQFTR